MIQLLVVCVDVLLLRSSDGLVWDIDVTIPLEVILGDTQHAI